MVEVCLNFFYVVFYNLKPPVTSYNGENKHKKLNMFWSNVRQQNKAHEPAIIDSNNPSKFCKDMTNAADLQWPPQTQITTLCYTTVESEKIYENNEWKQRTKEHLYT